MQAVVTNNYKAIIANYLPGEWRILKKLKGHFVMVYTEPSPSKLHEDEVEKAQRRCIVYHGVATNLVQMTDSPGTSPQRDGYKTASQNRRLLQVATLRWTWICLSLLPLVLVKDIPMTCAVNVRLREVHPYSLSPGNPKVRGCLRTTSAFPFSNQGGKGARPCTLSTCHLT